LLFFWVFARFFYPPLKILEMKEKGGEEEVSMFPRTKRVFSTTKSKERKRGGRFSALRDRKRERERFESVEYVFLFFLSIIDPGFLFPLCFGTHQKRVSKKKQISTR